VSGGASFPFPLVDVEGDARERGRQYGRLRAGHPAQGGGAQRYLSALARQPRGRIRRQRAVGDPRQRDAEAVLADVRRGLVSVERAREDYGVVLRADGRDIDAGETARLRGNGRG
jgi:hypothetical protein